MGTLVPRGDRQAPLGAVVVLSILALLACTHFAAPQGGEGTDAVLQDDAVEVDIAVEDALFQAGKAWDTDAPVAVGATSNYGGKKTRKAETGRDTRLVSNFIQAKAYAVLVQSHVRTFAKEYGPHSLSTIGEFLLNIGQHSRKQPKRAAQEFKYHMKLLSADNTSGVRRYLVRNLSRALRRGQGIVEMCERRDIQTGQLRPMACLKMHNTGVSTGQASVPTQVPRKAFLLQVLALRRADKLAQQRLETHATAMEQTGKQLSTHAGVWRWPRKAMRFRRGGLRALWWQVMRHSAATAVKQGKLVGTVMAAHEAARMSRTAPKRLRPHFNPKAPCFYSWLRGARTVAGVAATQGMEVARKKAVAVMTDSWKSQLTGCSHSVLKNADYPANEVGETNNGRFEMTHTTTKKEPLTPAQLTTIARHEGKARTLR